MKYEDKKIVGILATNVDASVALNVIGHLAIAIGKYSDSEIRGQPVIKTSDGVEHLGISQFPFIVTKVKPSKLKNAILKAKENPNLLVAAYPKDMLETRTDEELVASIGAKKNDELEYFGAILYGNTSDVNEITGKIQLWRIED